MDNAVEVTCILNGTDITTKHMQMLIEDSVMNHNSKLGPDGISSNAIFRSLYLVG